MKNVIESNEYIENLIFEVRGKQVMLDSDLARLYGVETKRINEAVKNNLEKFPERFSWILTKDEARLCSRSKFSTLNTSKTRGQNMKYLPRVFTEQGVAMITTILRSKKATEVSIAIMDAFVFMRHYIIENKDIYKTLNNINNKLIEHDEKINYIFSKFDKKEMLFLTGQTYDAYREIATIIDKAKKEIIIIDSYADSSLLDFFQKVNSKIILIVSSKAKLSDIEIDKFNKQYNNKLKVVKNNTFHDRYFVIDNKDVYHIGTSLNYAGEKMFSINKLEDKIIIDELLSYVTQIIK